MCQAIYRRVRVTTGAVKKELIITYFSVFVALVTQHAKRMCCVTLSSVACTALSYFSILSHKRHYSRKNVTERIIRVLISFKLLTETFLILRIIRRDTFSMYIALQVKYPLFLSDFNET